MNHTEALMALLTDLPGNVDWSPQVPGDATYLDALEEELGITLPEEYREPATRYNRSQLAGRTSTIALFAVQDLLEMNTDDRWSDDLPGMFVFGADNGGMIFYIDLKGQLGRGAGAIYTVEMGVGTPGGSVFAASSLYDLYRRVVDGEDRTQGPYLEDDECRYGLKS